METKEKDNKSHSVEINLTTPSSLFIRKFSLIISGPKGSISTTIKSSNYKIRSIAYKKIVKIKFTDKTLDKSSIKNIRSICSIIKLSLNGVLFSFIYKMYICFAHFPISVFLDLKIKEAEIKNFLGEKRFRISNLNESGNEINFVTSLLVELEKHQFHILEITGNLLMVF